MTNYSHHATSHGPRNVSRHVAKCRGMSGNVAASGTPARRTLYVGAISTAPDFVRLLPDIRHVAAQFAQPPDA